MIRRPLPEAGAPCNGVTLLEMMAAVLILALLLTLSKLALDNLAGWWRLRAAAHQVENVVRWAQNAAATTGGPTQVLYDVPQGAFCARMAAGTRAENQLPTGVRFVSVRFPDGVEVMSDVAAATAYADGTLDPHTVILSGDAGARVVMAFDRLTGEMTYEEKLGDSH